MILKLIGDSTNKGRGLTWIWGPLSYGLEVAWSQERHWFIGFRKDWPK